MKSLIAGLAILTPAYIYSILSTLSLSRDNVIAITLISLLSLSVLLCTITLSKENN
jgi:hypothetical protein